MSALSNDQTKIYIKCPKTKSESKKETTVTFNGGKKWVCVFFFVRLLFLYLFIIVTSSREKSNCHRKLKTQHNEM